MKNVIVKCPKCREVLEINPNSGSVIKHHPEVKAGPGGDFLKERLKSLEEEKARRESMVADSRTREKNRHEKFDEIFKKVKDQAKEGPPAERPLRDIDLD